MPCATAHNLASSYNINNINLSNLIHLKVLLIFRKYILQNIGKYVSFVLDYSNEKKTFKIDGRRKSQTQIVR